MNGVSCRAFGVVLDGAASGHVSLDRLIDGLGVTAEFVSTPSNQISWDTCTAILDRLSDELGGAEGLRQFGEDNVATETLRIFKRVGRALSHPRDIYFMGARWMGPSLFPMTNASISERDDGVLVQRITIHDGYRDCPAFFQLLQGCLATAAVALGHGRSDVELDLEPHRAIYRIRPNTMSSGRIGQIFRSVRARIILPSILHELESQQAEIEDSYRELRRAHKQISAQAEDLAQVNSIGQRLSEQIDLTLVVNVLIRIILEELGIPGVELRLYRADVGLDWTDRHAEAPPRLVRTAGHTDGQATRCHLLEAASHPLGTLRVWHGLAGENADPNGHAKATANEALLERLLPWIAVALDNARAYEALERHAAALEQRVTERTTRLLSANHHLVREIEERQRATDALMESEAQLHASERLASIGTLAAGIAHEINNPIGSILAAAQLAQLVRTDGDGDAQVSASLETIVEQTKRCGEIVRSVLQFSRNEATQKWVSKINDVVARSIKLTEGFAFEQQARIDFDIPTITLWAKINPIQIEQAVVNLIRNAIESGAKQITVNLDEHQRDGSVTIQVRDNGPGVEDSDRLRIFDPFYTTKQNVGGTGLGLSVVHGIAVEHGGSLKVATTRDPGTTIRFILPTCPAPANPLAEKPDDPDRPAS